MSCVLYNNFVMMLKKKFFKFIKPPENQEILNFTNYLYTFILSKIKPLHSILCYRLTNKFDIFT